MKYELILKEEADQEIIESYTWYEHQQEGLGESFLMELEKYFSVIQKNPQLYAVRHDNKRAAVLRRFPYLIVYEETKKQVIVYAVFHVKRDPEELTQR